MLYGDVQIDDSRSNPVGEPDTITFAASDRGFVELITPAQYADANLVFGHGYNTVSGLGSPTRALIESFRRQAAPRPGK